MNHDCCPIEQTARQTRLEVLYAQDVRHDPAHPLHGVYTGLHISDLERRAIALNPEPPL